MTLKYSFRLTEEIARWAFEVHIATATDWKIVFTNPTAGPWKRLMAPDSNGTIGEVHRFEREEDRPDLVLVNDALQVLLIIEAKDTLEKLVSMEQIKKSSDVAISLAHTLSKKEKNPYWAKRAQYTTMVGLLWGATEKTNETSRKELFSKYRDSLKPELHNTMSPVLLGIESNKDQGTIVCTGLVSKSADVYRGLSPEKLLASLKL